MFKNCFVWVASLVFILMSLIGLFSGVTWTTALLRGMGGGMVIGLATFVLVKYLGSIIIPNPEFDAGPEIAAAAENLFDVIVPGEDPTKVGIQDKGPELSAVAYQQIDPDLEEIIRKDPLRAAQMLEKMGLDS